MSIRVILKNLKKKVLQFLDRQKTTYKEYEQVLNVGNKSEMKTTKNYNDFYLTLKRLGVDLTPRWFFQKYTFQREGEILAFF